MTSSNGNIFRVTGHLCGEFTGPGEFPTQRPVTRSFDVFFELRLNKRLSKQPWGWWFEPLSRPFWRHRNDYFANIASSIGFDDASVSVDDALHKHSSHPSVIKIKESLTGPYNFTFQAVSPEKINQKLMTIDIKKPPGVITSLAKSYVWPTMSQQLRWPLW